MTELRRHATDVLGEAARRLLAERALIIASNRGPVEFGRDADGNLSFERGAGGVVTAMSAAAKYSHPIWVASAMTEGDRQRAAEAERAGEPLVDVPDTSFRLRFVRSDPEAYDRYYNRIANPLLWFLQHYLWDTPRAPDIDAETWQAWREGYVTVNREFAQEIAAAARAAEQPALVMLQDYHLYLVPGFLRELRPDLLLQLFVHIPWPDADYWRLLPPEMRQAICAGLLQCDLVGFQTAPDARSFMHTCEASLDDVDLDYRAGLVRHNGRVTRVRDYPISIDTEAVRALAFGKDAERHLEQLAAFTNEFTLVRVDRAEPSKNIVRGFHAFERFLSLHPEFVGRVNFLAFLVPSRLEVAEYQNYLDEISAVVMRINATYASQAEFAGQPWQPVILFIGDDYPRGLAALRRYDVLLVNSLYDGMNLVAKEGALVNERAGVLILSEGAGAFGQLGSSAVAVTPTDIEGTAEAIYTALTMPREERARRAAAMRQVVEEQDIVAWIDAQLTDLAQLVEPPSAGG